MFVSLSFFAWSALASEKLGTRSGKDAVTLPYRGHGGRTSKSRVCVTDERQDTEPARARRLSTGDCRIGTAVTQASGCGGCNADDDAGCEHEAIERLSRAGTPWRLLGFRCLRLSETLVAFTVSTR